MKFAKSVRLFGAAATAALLISPVAQADSGFYVGGALGDTSIKDSVGFDENDSSWKVMGGFIFDVPMVDFAVEIAHNDFGEPSQDVLGTEVGLQADGQSAFAVLGMDWGLFGAFAKAGVVAWDAEALVDGASVASDSGTDGAYGLGMRFNFSSVELRAEYELFDVADADDVDMLSVGFIWRF